MSQEAQKEFRKYNPFSSLLPFTNNEPINIVLAGLVHDRYKLIDIRDELMKNPVWTRFGEFYAKHTEEIAAIDKRIDSLLSFVVKPSQP